MADEIPTTSNPDIETGDETHLTTEERLAARHRREAAAAVDDADASHQGGMGAQGGAVDFGNPKNFGLPD